MKLAGTLSQIPFVPHSFAHLLEHRVFPEGALPEAAYAKMVAEYEAVDDVEVYDIVYESDGLRITGLAALPKDSTPTRLLIYNRGGAREYGKLTVLSALRSMIPFARAGYAVLASNYRGGAGSEGADEFGGADVYDVLNLLALGQKQSFWDQKNSFMLGHSRGGMMTTLALKQGAPVQAAVSLAGISDAREVVTPEGRLALLVGEQDFERSLRDRSSVCWPEQISAPLLLLHGDADKDVPASHSILLAGALSQLRKPHSLTLFEGGNHALTRHWSEVTSQTLAWFDRYSA